MDILTSQLPSGGYGYDFPSVSISPMTFIEICKYLDNVPQDPLEKYLYDIRLLIDEDEKIKKCYIMDVDFLIFYKKLCTVSENLTYKISITCPHCKSEIKKSISFDKDIHFKKIEQTIMNGAVINLNGNKYETIIPTVEDFMKVFGVYLRYKKITDLKMIKTIALIRDFEMQGNKIEEDILNATHSDITLLLALRELYYDQLEPIEVFCPQCNKGLKKNERRSVAVSVESLIVDFFRDLTINSPIDGTKILFK